MRWLLTLLTFLLLVSPCEAKRKWRTYEKCTLRPNKSNDGDSFHVKRARSHYIFRLYFVDTCETDDSLEERVVEQGEYFGVDVRRAIQLGKEAKKFTEKFLADGFTAHSKLKDARGRSDRKRYYAMIQVGDEYLSEALVANGLARIHGNHENLPDGTSSRLFFWRLKKAEKEAKRKKLGGWSERLSRIETIRREADRSARAPDTGEAPTVSKVNGTHMPNRPTMPERPTAPTISSAIPDVQPQTITTTRPLTVYSLKEPGKQVGILKAGAEVKVLGAESPSMIRIRFKAATGKAYEAQCWKVELGL